MKWQATLIGDVVGSRDSGDRSHLHAAVSAALARVNATCMPVSPLRITVGDEYQGRYATVGQALHAAIALRLILAPSVDVRHGIGSGGVEVLQADPPVEDGPGWWAARAAITQVERAAQRRVTRDLRTGYARADAQDGLGPAFGPDPHAVNAALLAHDTLVAGAGDRGMSVLLGMLVGMSQIEIAREVGVSPSAVSQRVRGGLDVIHLIEKSLWEVT